jgi:adenylate cyclase
MAARGGPAPGVIQQRLERAYERLGPRYVRRAILIQGQLLYPVVFFGAWIASAYVPMSLRQYVELALLGCALQFAYTLVSDQAIKRLTVPIERWHESPDDEQRALDAWGAAAELPMAFVRRSFSWSLLGVSLWVIYAIWVAVFVWQLKLHVLTGLLVYGGVVVLIMYAVALRYFSTERIVRPVLRDIAAHVPVTLEKTRRGLSLRARMLVALPAINVVTAVVADAATHHGEGHLKDLVYVLLVGTGVAASVSLILTVLLADSITEPISELRAAAQRVGAGELSTRVAVTTTDETGELGRAFNEMAAGLEERERIRATLGTYVDRDVAEHILREGTSLAGEEVELTAMFLDIRNFTGYAERSPAPEVVATLNRLFGRIVPIIHDHGGHVDKFVGDGLLAVFGAPRRQADHADQALAAACKIAGAVEDEFGDDLAVGIGLNSGTVVAGNVGGAGRLEFSVIGDAVNVAARIESATRQTGDTVLVSENTRRLLNGRVTLRERPAVPLKGKTETIGLFAPDSDSGLP